MTITWYGQTCFRILAQKGKGESVNLLIDPFEKEDGLSAPRGAADIVLMTHLPAKKVSLKNSFFIEGPGEYNVNGVYIEGIEVSRDTTQSKVDGPQKTTLYSIDAEDMRLCHLGVMEKEELTSQQLEQIGNVDILMLPIGGVATLGAKEAIKIMAQIEPKITIPMYYRLPGLKIKLEGLDVFLKALGVKAVEHAPKLSIKKKDLSTEEAKIIVLKP